jgi:arylformamidase
MSQATPHEDEYLDQQYNPRLRVPDFAAVFAGWKERARQARATTEARVDLAYGSEPAERLDFFPATGGLRPLLLFLHGGYWRALDKDDFSWVAPPFVQAGVSVAVINYGLLPATSLAGIVQQVQRACIWLYNSADSLGIRATELVCSGHSAGGHLTAMMLGTNWSGLSAGLPRSLLLGGVAISGLFDLEPLTRAPFLRDDLGLTAATALGLSPAHLPLMNDSPLVRALGALETDEFHRQSASIERAWPTACRLPLIRLAGRNHMTACDALAEPAAELFAAARDLFG